MNNIEIYVISSVSIIFLLYIRCKYYKKCTSNMVTTHTNEIIARPYDEQIAIPVINNVRDPYPTRIAITLAT